MTWRDYLLPGFPATYDDPLVQFFFMILTVVMIFVVLKRYVPRLIGTCETSGVEGWGSRVLVSGLAFSGPVEDVEEWILLVEEERPGVAPVVACRLGASNVPFIYTQNPVGRSFGSLPLVAQQYVYVPAARSDDVPPLFNNAPAANVLLLDEV